MTGPFQRCTQQRVPTMNNWIELEIAIENNWAIADVLQYQISSSKTVAKLTFFLFLFFSHKPPVALLSIHPFTLQTCRTNYKTALGSGYHGYESYNFNPLITVRRKFGKDAAVNGQSKMSIPGFLNNNILTRRCLCIQAARQGLLFSTFRGVVRGKLPGVCALYFI